MFDFRNRLMKVGLDFEVATRRIVGAHRNEYRNNRRHLTGIIGNFRESLRKQTSHL